jgi:hypothetical protein
MRNIRTARGSRHAARSRSPRPSVMIAVGAAAALFGLLPGTPAASAQTPAPSPTPGVYVQELPSFDTLIGTPTGVPLFIGQGTAARPGPVVVNDLDDFDALVTDPSPALAAAVGAFYANGGGTAQVLTTAGEDAATLAAAADSQAGDANPEWQLLVVPALGSLAGADYSTVATAVGLAATQSSTLALLDPPTALLTGAAQDPTATTTSLTALADQLRLSGADPTRIVLLSSGLQDATTATPVPGAAVLAGVMDQADRTTGPWAGPAGVEYPLAGVTPVFSPSNALIGELQSAGLISFRTLVGYGTLVWGTVTLGRSVQFAVPDQRMSEFIFHTVSNGLQPWVFAANDATTWAQIVAATSAFLNSLWAQGGLEGATASDAFEVQAGVPATMTATDLLAGQLVVSVHVTFADQTTRYLTVVQTMQG